jgi:phage repressor protein C with HTH and peptisase S24 domain
MFKLLKVKGNSLMPEYHEGDFVIIRKIPFSTKKYRSGDILIFEHPDYGLMIKELFAVSTSETLLTVHGTHPDSIDSRDFGPINASDVMGKVIWHIKKPRQKS